MPKTWLVIEDASLVLITVVRALVRAKGTKPLMKRSKVMEVFDDGETGGKVQHGMEFQVLSNDIGRTGRNSLINLSNAALVSCIRAVNLELM